MIENEGSCIYNARPGDIHQFTLENTSQAVVDAWFVQMSLLHRQLSTRPDLRRVNLLIDVRRSGALPMSSTSVKLRQWMVEHTIELPVRVAVVYAEGFPLQTTATFTHMLRLPADIQFFASVEDAIVWLKMTT